jgi:hypothetical protein
MNKLTIFALLALTLCACTQKKVATAPTVETVPQELVNQKVDATWPKVATPEAKHAALPLWNVTELRTDHDIDSTLGDHVAYRKAMTDFQQAIAAKNQDAVAAMVRYPLTADVGGKKVKIESAAQFKEYYNTLITPQAAKEIANTHYPYVAYSDQGVMLGNNNVWLDGVCSDTACKKVDVKVITIQPPPNPPTPKPAP